MLTREDIRGVYAMPATPCKDGQGGWQYEDSVDLDEAARMVDQLADGGVAGIALCGTTGECAALLWEEKVKFVDTAVQTSRKRVQLFAGVTALGTKEIVRQMRAMKEIGADGAFVGLPLWQTPTLENSIQFFADLSEAVPDMPVMVYSNAMFFKSMFPTAFWAGVARKAPTVVTNKIAYPIGQLLDDIKVAGNQIRFLPGERMIYTGYKLDRDHVKAVWSTAAAMGPEPVVALMDAILKQDDAGVDEIWRDIDSIPHFIHDRGEFAKYNAQSEKWRFNATGFINYGPPRAPYYDLPEEWKRAAEAEANAWQGLRKKYAKVSA